MRKPAQFALSMTALAAVLACAGCLAAQLAARMTPEDVNRLPSSRPLLTASYGSDPLQVGDLRLPFGKGPFPVVVVIHGGCWLKGLADRQNTAALATALTAHGFATWNIEYRQEGDPGAGWPGTFLDWGAATDYLRVLAETQPLRLDEVATVGHSAGGYAAIWVASRHRLAAGTEIRAGSSATEPLPIRAAVSMDGPVDIRGFVGADAVRCGEAVVVPLLGGTPAQQPLRYSAAEPQDHLPLGVAQMLVVARFLHRDEAEDYVARAAKAGDHAEVLPIHNSGHFEIIAPGSAPWKNQVEAPLVAFLQRNLSTPPGPLRK